MGEDVGEGEAEGGFFEEHTLNQITKIIRKETSRLLRVLYMIAPELFHVISRHSLIRHFFRVSLRHLVISHFVRSIARNQRVEISFFFRGEWLRYWERNAADAE